MIILKADFPKKWLFFRRRILAVFRPDFQLFLGNETNLSPTQTGEGAKLSPDLFSPPKSNVSYVWFAVDYNYIIK